MKKESQKDLATLSSNKPVLFFYLETVSKALEAQGSVLDGRTLKVENVKRGQRRNN